jgi:putative tricarboxylic transport membrane protein
MTITEGLLVGLQAAMQPNILMYCFIGVFLGTLIGVLPGIGALAAISLLLPVTYHMDAATSIVMLAGVYYGAEYGGSTASILLNLPGTASNAVTCLDGHPMAKQGRAGVALFTTTIASFIGGIFGILALIIFAPYITAIGLKFGPTEYFSMMLLGLVAASTLASGSPAKGLAMVVLGLLLGTAGSDVNSGITRFDFDIPELADGINLVALAMGLFGVSEIISSITRTRNAKSNEKITMRSMIPTKEDVKASTLPIIRGSGVGGFFGALPGTGASIAAFMSYALEKKLAKDPSRFGKGAIEGIAAPEAANNSAVQCAFIPTLTLGIPGSATMAIMLGALIIHGIQPGPMLVVEQPALFWGLIVSFFIGNVMLMILNIPLIGVWVSILRIPYHVLYPAILVFIALGVYSVQNNASDILMVGLIGLLGYGMYVLRFEAAPLLLGFVLGPLMEENLRRALLLSYGDLTTFITNPISAGILATSALILLWSIGNVLRRFAQRRARKTA